MVTWLSDVGAYLLHCGAGIYGVADPRGSGPEDNRPADLWDTPNYAAICAGIRDMRALIRALPEAEGREVSSTKIAGCLEHRGIERP